MKFYYLVHFNENIIYGGLSRSEAFKNARSTGDTSMIEVYKTRKRGSILERSGERIKVYEIYKLATFLTIL